MVIHDTEYVLLAELNPTIFDEEHSAAAARDGIAGKEEAAGKYDDATGVITSDRNYFSDIDGDKESKGLSTFMSKLKYAASSTCATVNRTSAADDFIMAFNLLEEDVTTDALNMVYPVSVNLTRETKMHLLMQQHLEVLRFKHANQFKIAIIFAIRNILAGDGPRTVTTYVSDIANACMVVPPTFTGCVTWKVPHLPSGNGHEVDNMNIETWWQTCLVRSCQF